MSWRLFLVFSLILSGVKADSITGWTTPCGSFLTHVEKHLAQLRASLNLQMCIEEEYSGNAVCAIKFMVTNDCATREDLSVWSASSTSSNCSEATSFASSFSPCSGSETFCAGAGEGEATSDCLGSIYTNDCKEGGSEACQTSLVVISKKRHQVKSALVSNCKGAKKPFRACVDAHPSWKEGGGGPSIGKWLSKLLWYLVGLGALLLVGGLVCVACCCLLAKGRGPKGWKPSLGRGWSSRGRGRSKVADSTAVQNKTTGDTASTTPL